MRKTNDLNAEKRESANSYKNNIEFCSCYTLKPIFVILNVVMMKISVTIT